MKTLIILLVCLVPAIALADPIYKCDCQPDTTYFEIDIDGVITSPAGQSTQDCLLGEIRPWHDLAGLAEGPHTIQVRGCNMWGCTDWSDPLSFTVTLPLVPAGCHH